MSLYKEALDEFHNFFKETEQAGPDYPTAMTLATADANGRPSARIVLLKEVDEDGFVFYTNQRSRKGRDLAANPYGALVFYWQAIMRQVRVEGKMETVSAQEADEYWQTRPRESQIGAWASEQSSVIESAESLKARFDEYEAQFVNKDVPRPPHWSGYRLRPEVIEFWREQPYRLHERVCYRQAENGWVKELLSP